MVHKCSQQVAWLELWWAKLPHTKCPLCKPLNVRRPRAGRIEEETRLARSVELVAQRRRVEGHLRAQSRAVKAQAAQFSEWASGMEAEVSKQVRGARDQRHLGICIGYSF